MQNTKGGILSLSSGGRRTIAFETDFKTVKASARSLGQPFSISCVTSPCGPESEVIRARCWRAVHI